ncbi:hypothetical protein DQ309_RS06950 [Escherichia coli]|nr:hypothetical protein [Escherichia coli]EEV6062169.1 hypothetical protein [Escherichia coli]EEY3746702.1 hypothetical protein [Escherichia coli]EFB3607006.1 hypothetical protein [Escherichia coli]EFB5970602.1 hypothetical protein [Escherichia coli]
MIPVMAENVVYVPSANGSKKKTPPSVVENRVIEALTKLPYKVTYRGFVGEYIGVKSKVALSCECGREFVSGAYDVIGKGSGCRACCIRKYKKLDAQYLYVLQCGDIGKIGVSGDIRTRLGRIRYDTGLDFKIVHLQEMPDKRTALSTERAIKSIVCKGGAFDIASGWTETFHYCNKSLNNIKNIASVEWN